MRVNYYLATTGIFCGGGGLLFGIWTASEKVSIPGALIGCAMAVTIVLVWGMRSARGPLTELTNAEHAMRTELLQLRALSKAMPDTLLVVNRQAGVEYIRPGAQISDVMKNLDVRGTGLAKILSKNDYARSRAHVRTCLDTGEPQQFDLTLTHDGQDHHYEIRATPGINDQAVVVVRDLTEHRTAEQRIKHLAYYDGLTGLRNRAALTLKIDELVEAASTHPHAFALFFIDVDRFKHYNDNLGHEAGDQVLTHIATQIRRSLRPEDTVAYDRRHETDVPARIGGDEFVLLLDNVDNEETVNSIAKRLLKSIESPFYIQQQQIKASVSVGIALFPEHGSSRNELFHQADIAMYTAKRAGGNSFQVYQPAMGERKRRRLSTETKLRKAIETEALYLVYQPQIDLATNEVIGAEALLRWQDGDAHIPPSQFIPIAEETGLILPLGQWVLHTVTQQIATWQARRFHPGSIGINVSADQFGQDHFAESILLAAAHANVAHDLINIEVTESAVMKDSARTIEILHTLRAEGIAIALDDFGTGYSSLNYLNRLPLDVLKVDRSFISQLNHDHQESAIVSTIIHLGHEFDLKVLAEGVETAEQAEILHGLGCDQVQGYYYSRPVVSSDLEALLQADNTELYSASGNNRLMPAPCDDRFPPTKAVDPTSS